MDLSRIKELIHLVETSDIEELEVSRWGRRVRISKTRTMAEQHARGAVRPVEIALPIPPPPEPMTAEDTDLVPIKSPMVGTFYRAPAPDARPYVEVDDRVDKEQVVCIIEAMKLMNEIRAEVRGRVARVLVENAQPVEYGQVLFLVAPI